MKLFYSSSIIKKSFIFTALLTTILATAFSQEIITAKDYFESVSAYYSTLKDYQADVKITVAKNEMQAHVTYLQPDKVRMDFSVPANQTIVFNGETLTIYVPLSGAILTQNAAGKEKGVGAATADGLSLLRRYYTVAYEVGQEPVPLEENSEEMVIKLILWKRTTAEAFKNIKIAINPETKLIRRVEAQTSANDSVYIFDYSKYELNQDITAQRFSYDMPAAANTYDNFLFSE